MRKEISLISFLVFVLGFIAVSFVQAQQLTNEQLKQYLVMDAGSSYSCAKYGRTEQWLKSQGFVKEITTSRPEPVLWADAKVGDQYGQHFNAPPLAPNTTVLVNASDPRLVAIIWSASSSKGNIVGHEYQQPGGRNIVCLLNPITTNSTSNQQTIATTTGNNSNNSHERVIAVTRSNNNNVSVNNNQTSNNSSQPATNSTPEKSIYGLYIDTRVGKEADNVSVGNFAKELVDKKYFGDFFQAISDRQTADRILSADCRVAQIQSYNKVSFLGTLGKIAINRGRQETNNNTILNLAEIFRRDEYHVVAIFEVTVKTEITNPRAGKNEARSRGKADLVKRFELEFDKTRYSRPTVKRRTGLSLEDLKEFQTVDFDYGDNLYAQITTILADRVLLETIRTKEIFTPGGVR